MQPTLHMSILVLYVLEPSKTSGARYHSVTTYYQLCPDNQRHQRAYLVTEGVDGYTECSSETEITNLELSSPVNEQVLGLEISV